MPDLDIAQRRTRYIVRRHSTQILQLFSPIYYANISVQKNQE